MIFAYLYINFNISIIEIEYICFWRKKKTLFSGSKYSLKNSLLLIQSNDCMLCISNGLNLATNKVDQCIKKCEKWLKFVIYGDLRMLHDIANAIAICVHLKMDKHPNCSAKLEHEHTWPYSLKCFNNAAISKDMHKVRHLFACQESMNSTSVQKCISRYFANINWLFNKGGLFSLLMPG